MGYVRKAYEMMFFWIGFGGVMGYLTYTLAPSVKFLRNRPGFRTIRLTLTALPLCIFPYYGIKFMIFYKRKGAREVTRDSSNVMSEEEYERQLKEHSAVRPSKEAQL
jgi:hypothetical protein